MLLNGLLMALALSSLVSVHAPAEGTTAASIKASPAKSNTVTEIRIDKSDHALKLYAGSDVVTTPERARATNGE